MNYTIIGAVAGCASTAARLRRMDEKANRGSGDQEELKSIMHE